jgi:hypothetical protein
MKIELKKDVKLTTPNGRIGGFYVNLENEPNLVLTKGSSFPVLGSFIHKGEQYFVLHIEQYTVPIAVEYDPDCYKIISEER